MKYTLPTLHVLYFGIQVKKGKLDSVGMSKDGSSNVAEILNQVTMMLGHEIFDPEVNRRVLVDHAFIVAGGADSTTKCTAVEGSIENLLWCAES